MTGEPLECAFPLCAQDGDTGNHHREAWGRFDEVAQNHCATAVRP
jgi:hypothetical protein